jgi:hypothetical protein
LQANHPRTSRSELTNEIDAAFREGRAPLISMSHFAAWSAALDDLLIRGRLPPVRHAAEYLAAAFPTSTYLRNLSQVFQRMPAADECHLPFHDDIGNEVQIVRRDNSETVLFVFCDRANRAGLPLCVLHSWLAQLPTSVVYLRDFQQVIFLAGIGSLGRDRDATLASLRSVVASLGARRILCHGNSGGVLAALHYGLDLGAEAVLCLSGVTNISAKFNAYLHSAETVARLNRVLPNAALDLRLAYETAKHPPQARIVYAKNNWDDRLHAEHMGGLPTVTLQAVPDTASHNVVMDLILRGEYQGLLDWLVSPGGPPP